MPAHSHESWGHSQPWQAGVPCRVHAWPTRCDASARCALVDGGLRLLLLLRARGAAGAAALDEGVRQLAARFLRPLVASCLEWSEQLGVHGGLTPHAVRGQQW